MHRQRARDVNDQRQHSVPERYERADDFLVRTSTPGYPLAVADFPSASDRREWPTWEQYQGEGTAEPYEDSGVSANILTAVLFLGLGTIAAYDILVLIKGGAGPVGISLGPLEPAHWFDGSFSMGILLALGMYGGFEVAVLFREELDNPDRMIPRVTYGVIMLAMATYALSSLLFINSVGIPNVVATARADPTAAMTRSLVAAGGCILAETATATPIISTLAVALAAHNITARYVFNLSADKILPSRLSGVHRRHGSPHAASLATSAAAFALGGVVVASHLTAITFYTAMLGITSFVISVVIFIASLAVPIYLHRHRHRHTVWNTKVCPILAILGLGVGLALATLHFSSLVGGSTTLAVALMVLIVGIFSWEPRSRASTGESGPRST